MRGVALGAEALVVSLEQIPQTCSKGGQFYCG